MNSQSPTTVGWPPPVIEKDHFTFSLGTSAALRPGWRWKRVEASSTPMLVQSPAPALIGGLTAHMGSGAFGPLTATCGISWAPERAGAADAVAGAEVR